MGKDSEVLGRGIGELREDAELPTVGTRVELGESETLPTNEELNVIRYKILEKISIVLPIIPTPTPIIPTSNNLKYIIPKPSVSPTSEHPGFAEPAVSPNPIIPTSNNLEYNNIPKPPRPSVSPTSGLDDSFSILRKK